MKTTILKSLALGFSLTALPALAATPDGLITSKTKLSLWTTANVKSTAVHVDTNDGVVVLHGKVSTAEQKAIAEKTTREVMGVVDVKNLLQVVPEAQEKAVARADKDTQAAIEKRLKADGYLKDSSIAVKSVDKGVVLLAGSATSLSDHLRAISIVDQTPGVKRVVSEVKSPDAFGDSERVVLLSESPAKQDMKGEVKKQPAETKSSATDMRITTGVKMKLLTAAEISSTDISVDTENGVVTLFGMVPNSTVEKSALAVAGKVAGVTKVNDQLEIVAPAAKSLAEKRDDEISRDLGVQFKDRPQFKAVNTAVTAGHVRLTGTVSSIWDSLSAVRAARACAGVKGVENELKIDDKAS